MMNRYVPVGLALIALPFLVALRASDVLNDIGVTMTDVRTGTLQSLRREGVFMFSPNSAIRAAAARIPVGSRAATVQMLGNVVRSYVESDAFRHDYQQALRDQSPDDEAYSTPDGGNQPTDSEAAINAQATAMQQAYLHLNPATLYSAITAQLPQMEAELATLQGEDRRLMQQHITETNRMLAACAGQPAEFKKQYLAYQLQQLRQSARKPADGGLPKATPHTARPRNAKALPASQRAVQPLLKKQLAAFVALCNDVDFNAKLVANETGQEFANPAYRAKSANWKLLFRMGKEPVMAARAFAQAWLADLG